LSGEELPVFLCSAAFGTSYVARLAEGGKSGIFLVSQQAMDRWGHNGSSLWRIVCFLKHCLVQRLSENIFSHVQ
jgi:hypothetical protein